MNTPQPVIVDQAALDWEGWHDADLAAKSNVRWKLLIAGERTDSIGLVTGIAEIPPGEQLLLHHHEPEETYYILSGRGQIEIDGRTTTVGPGYAVYIPPTPNTASAAPAQSPSSSCSPSPKTASTRSSTTSTHSNLNTTERRTAPTPSHSQAHHPRATTIEQVSTRAAQRRGPGRSGERRRAIDQREDRPCVYCLPPCRGGERRQAIELPLVLVSGVALVSWWESPFGLRVGVGAPWHAGTGGVVSGAGGQYPSGVMGAGVGCRLGADPRSGSALLCAPGGRRRYRGLGCSSRGLPLKGRSAWPLP